MLLGLELPCPRIPEAQGLALGAGRGGKPARMAVGCLA